MWKRLSVQSVQHQATHKFSCLRAELAGNVVTLRYGVSPIEPQSQGKSQGSHS